VQIHYTWLISLNAVIWLSLIDGIEYCGVEHCVNDQIASIVVTTAVMDSLLSGVETFILSLAFFLY
jgi:hypothetical protein